VVIDGGDGGNLAGEGGVDRERAGLRPGGNGGGEQEEGRDYNERVSKRIHGCGFDFMGIE